MRRPVARRPGVRIGIGAVLVCVLPLSACVPNIRLLSARVEVAAIESQPAEYKGWPQDGAMLRVELQTSRNLRAIADDHELNVGADAFLCHNRRDELSVMPYLFDEGGRIDAYHGPGSGSKAMWFYLAQSSRPRKSLNGVRELPAYDLRTVTDDICIEVRGGNMLGQTIRSNRLRVPAKTQ